MTTISRTGRLALFLFVALMYLASYAPHGPTPPLRNASFADDIYAARYQPVHP